MIVGFPKIDSNLCWVPQDLFQPPLGLLRPFLTMPGSSQVASNRNWIPQDRFQPSLGPPRLIPTKVGSPKTDSNHHWVLQDQFQPHLGLLRPFSTTVRSSWINYWVFPGPFQLWLSPPKYHSHRVRKRRSVKKTSRSSKQPLGLPWFSWRTSTTPKPAGKTKRGGTKRAEGSLGASKTTISISRCFSTARVAEEPTGRGKTSGRLGLIDLGLNPIDVGLGGVCAPWVGV